MGSSLKRFLRYSSISLLLLTAVNATVAGVLFILDPSGHKMGMSVSYIENSPFNSYLIPGIVLAIVNYTDSVRNFTFQVERKGCETVAVLVFIPAIEIR